MRDLSSRRQAYLVRGSSAHPRPVYQAHRALRNAAVIGGMLGVVQVPVLDVLERIDRALTEREYALEEVDESEVNNVPPVAIDAAAVPVLRDAARAVRDALRVGIDEHLQPRGAIGRRIVEDIEHSGDLALFERHGGVLWTAQEMLTVSDLELVLDDVVVALDEAVARGLEVVLLDDPGWPVGYYGDTPEERR